jgi:hypothetical protein
MRYTVICVLAGLFSALSIPAQVSPTPVINNEIRDPASMRTRAVELEKVKRDSGKITFDKPSKEQAVKFAEIKEDFENIQKLEAEIIRAYTAEKEINFKKIADAAADISRRGTRLDANLFIPKTEKSSKNKDTEPAGQKSLRDLIIDLDELLGAFVTSPIFTNNKLIDSKMSETSQNQLEKIIKISALLAREAKTIK